MTLPSLCFHGYDALLLRSSAVVALDHLIVAKAFNAGFIKPYKRKMPPKIILLGGLKSMILAENLCKICVGIGQNKNANGS